MAALHSPVMVEFRRHLYELAAEQPDRDPSMLGREAWDMLDEKPKSKSVRNRANVISYLSNPDKYSPFVDEIAVERALDFDWDVIANLTPLEWEVVVDRLARMYDPWDYHASNGGWRKIAKSGGNWSKDLGGALPTIDITTARRRRFMSGGEKERRALQRRVFREVREREEREAQAA